jgi:hypothetical protein
MEEKLMTEKISYAKRLEVFRMREETGRKLRRLLDFDVYEYLSAAVDEAYAKGESQIAERLRSDTAAIHRILTGYEYQTVKDILELIIDSFGKLSEDAFTPDDIEIIIRSLFIDPFELYRKQNKCEYSDILSAFRSD